MPGSSLWLLPPPSHALTPLLTELIRQTSSHFNSPHLFIPHVTLTSELNPDIYGSSPQEWLDSFSFPKGQDIVIHLGQLGSEDFFFRKLYSLVQKTEAITQLGRLAREHVQKEGEDKDEWAKHEYMPHLSLLYSDVPKVSDDKLEVVRGLAKDLGVRLDGDGELGGWVGGRVVLVPTDNEIKDWIPIAARDL
ncbi:2, 3 cyclic phosphodiesterase [Periconia macrospinosa]|uniref:2, 3 cyclic phosphodiesterase n=1 Tax=Periconia macrospinosa TaxID=97972 RepID=A0A2V1EDE7_9PLEO|nr:2, 3 cyclic phosphodiesterase [Periconia macrospinosa]